MKSDYLSSRKEFHYTFFKVSVIVWLAFSLHIFFIEPTRDSLNFNQVLAWGISGILFFLVFSVTTLFFDKIKRRILLLLFILESLLVLMGNAFLNGSSVQAALLLLISAQLAFLIPFRYAFIWITIQSTLLALIMFLQWDDIDALAFSTGYFGFQILAFITIQSSLREIKARIELSKVNHELIKSRKLLEEATRRAERLHISRELHDVAGHSLMALDMHLDIGLHLLMADRSCESKKHFYSAKEVGKRLLKDVRNTVKGLRSSLQHDFHYEIYHLTEQTLLDVNLDIDQDFKINCPQKRHVLLRSLQEILVNTTLHAEAEHLWVSLKEEEQKVTLQVVDDGKGVKNLIEGCGLTGMRERVEGVGGEISIYTAPNQGMNIRIQLPMSEAV